MHRGLDFVGMSREGLTFSHLIMKLLLPLLLMLISGAALATPVKLTVHGSDVEQTNAIVTFDAPNEWKGEHWLSSKGGSLTCKLQVADSGKAALIVPKIGPRETITFTATSRPPVLVAEGIQVEETDRVLRFSNQSREKKQTIFDYQMEAGPVPAGVSEVFKHGAHLHPVYSPSGRLVTGNHPIDHRWHRGIWMAWTKTEFGEEHPDFWNQGKEGKDKSEDQILAEVRFDSLVKRWSGPVQGGFISKHRFLDHSHGITKDVLHETWEVHVYAVGSAFVFDLISTQTCAGQVPLKLPLYHYGGLGVRGHEFWNPVDKVAMLTSEGHDRKKGDSTKARWVHMGGEVEGQLTGMSILIHPDNFRFPQPLRLNPKNPQLCIAPSQEGDWSIEPGKPYVSKYRFVVSDGSADAQVIETAWQVYAKPLKVSF